MVAKSLANNIALVIILCYMYTVLYRRKIALKPLTYTLFSAMLFSIIGIAVMLTPIQLTYEIIFDIRSILLSIEGLSGGGTIAAISVIITAMFEYLLGDDGEILEIGVILLSG